PSSMVHTGGHLLEEDLEENVRLAKPNNGGGKGLLNSKKRFRTKFTYEQLEKMFGFAVKFISR
ncbi:zinc finger-homeodomain protein, partial [Trifolium medium]|nr:zinc finger-homeodomain protein [Trifolium medium]